MQLPHLHSKPCQTSCLVPSSLYSCNRDIKKLGLAFRASGNKSPLRFDHMFIPLNTCNTEGKEWTLRYFVCLCKESIIMTRSRLYDKSKYQGKIELQNQVDNLMPTQDSLAHYADFFHQQSEILLLGIDEEAFRCAVERFPHLTKVIVTEIMIKCWLVFEIN